MLVNRRSSIALSAVKLGVSDIFKTDFNRILLLYRPESLVLPRMRKSRRILCKVTLKVRHSSSSIGLVCSHSHAWLTGLMVLLEQTCWVHDCVYVFLTIIGDSEVSRWFSHPCGHRSINRSDSLLFMCFDICASICTFMLLTWLTQAMGLISHFIEIHNRWRNRLRCGWNLLGRLYLTLFLHLFQLALLTTIKVLEI